jgi:hypothetical protein
VFVLLHFYGKDPNFDPIGNPEGYFPETVLNGNMHLVKTSSLKQGNIREFSGSNEFLLPFSC